MRNEKEFGKVLFNTTLKAEDPFRILNIRKSGFANVSSTTAKKCYNKPNNINRAKKKDLMDLLQFIDSKYPAFYKNLLTAADVGDLYPGTESESDEFED